MALSSDSRASACTCSLISRPVACAPSQDCEFEPVTTLENITITTFKSNGSQGGEAETGHHLPEQAQDHLQTSGRSLGRS